MKDARDGMTRRHCVATIGAGLVTLGFEGRMFVAQPAVTGIKLPDSQLARAATQFIRDTETDLLFQHSTRVFIWAALAGQRKALTFDPELLYIAAMFHDVGLTFQDSHLRYEIDGANGARDFLRSHGVPEHEAQKVWVAIAVHTTPGISPNLEPVGALTAEGVMMDLAGVDYETFTDAQRAAVAEAYPRSSQYAEEILQALYDGLKHRPETTQGTGLADVMVDKDPHFHRRDFAALMRNSPVAHGP